MHGEEKAFIAAQGMYVYLAFCKPLLFVILLVFVGPIFDTMPDFWRMVWEHDVHIIVMLTNLIENGRVGASSFFPATYQHFRKEDGGEKALGFKKLVGVSRGRSCF